MHSSTAQFIRLFKRYKYPPPPPSPPPAPVQGWWIDTSTYVSTDGDAYPVLIWDDVAVDSANNLYVAGHVNEVANLKAALAKYAPDGSLTWLHVQDAVANEYNDSFNAVAIGVSGNIYAVGRRFFSEASQTPTYGSLPIIAKFDPSGTRLWVKNLSETQVSPADDLMGYGYLNDVAVRDNAGQDQVWVTGYFESALASGTGGTITAALDASGDFVVAPRFFGTTNYNDGHQISVTPTAVYVLTGNGTNTSAKSTIIRYTFAGVLDYQAEMTTGMILTGMVPDPADNGQVYVVGNSRGIPQAGSTAFIGKINTATTSFVWQQYVTTLNDMAPSSYQNLRRYGAVDVDPVSGDVFWTVPDAGTGGGGESMFVARIDGSAGNFIWQIGFLTSTPYDVGDPRAYGIRYVPAIEGIAMVGRGYTSSQGITALFPASACIIQVLSNWEIMVTSEAFTVAARTIATSSYDDVSLQNVSNTNGGDLVMAALPVPAVKPSPQLTSQLVAIPLASCPGD
jgi:hypothetical protein